MEQTMKETGKNPDFTIAQFKLMTKCGQKKFTLLIPVDEFINSKLDHSYD